jgi:hypothetical protein
MWPRFVLLSVLAVPSIITCHHVMIDPETVEPNQVVPAPPSSVATDPCSLACRRLYDLKCPEWKGSPGGASCWDVCFYTESSGIAHFCPGAVAKIKTCAELDEAFLSCEKQEK